MDAVALCLILMAVSCAFLASLPLAARVTMARGTVVGDEVECGDQRVPRPPQADERSIVFVTADGRVIVEDPKTRNATFLCAGLMALAAYLYPRV